MPYSECSDENQQVSITGNFHLLALRGQQDRQDSDIALYNAEAISAPPPIEWPRAVWVWDWQKCGDQGGALWSGKNFQSKYQRPSGQWIDGTTTLSGDKGSYRTTGGQTGTLSGITCKDGGQTARGTWRFQSGGHGLVRVQAPTRRKFVFPLR